MRLQERLGDIRGDIRFVSNFERAVKLAESIVDVAARKSNTDSSDPSGEAS